LHDLEFYVYTLLGNAEEAVRPELTSEEKEAKENEWREELIKVGYSMIS